MKFVIQEDLEKLENRVEAIENWIDDEVDKRIKVSAKLKEIEEEYKENKDE